MSTVHLEITLHEDDEAGRFAEWEMWRVKQDQSVEWIGTGTTAMLESAWDRAYEVWAAQSLDSEPS